MKLLARSRRLRLGLIAALPIAASVAALAVSSPASAYALRTSCQLYQVCYYADVNFLPTSSILNMGQENHADWTNIADNGRVCGGIITHTWNDCVSSIKDRMTYYYMCNYKDAYYQNRYLETAPGENLANLVNNNFNDLISSNKYVTPTTPC